MKKIFVLIIALLSVGIISCKQEGCVDIKSNNYNKEAEVDDGSCTFDGNAVFWIDANTSQDLQNSWINELKIYVDGTYVGKMSTNSALLTAPDCNAGGISYFQDLGSEKSAIIKYEAKYTPIGAPGTNPPDEVLYEGSLKLIGGECQPFQLQ